MYVHWDVNPVIFELGALKAKYYGLFFSTLFLAGYLMLRYALKKEKRPAAESGRLVVAMIIGIVAGLRLGHVLFYNPLYYLTHPLDILMIWKGGLASHGAAVGALIALFIFSRRKQRPGMLWYLDRIVIPAAFGASLIRLGNLMNSEIIGTPTNQPWAFIFYRVDEIPRHPAQLYESLIYLFVFLLLAYLYLRRNAARKTGLLSGLFLTIVFSARFVIEFVKEDQSAFEAEILLNMGQWLSIPFVFAGLFLMLRRNKPQRIPIGTEKTKARQKRAAVKK